jgi:hypothetical protein
VATPPPRRPARSPSFTASAHHDNRLLLKVAEGRGLLPARVRPVKMFFLLRGEKVAEGRGRMRGFFGAGAQEEILFLLPAEKGRSAKPGAQPLRTSARKAADRKIGGPRYQLFER